MDKVNPSDYFLPRIFLGSGVLHFEWVRADTKILQNKKAYLHHRRNFQAIPEVNDPCLGRFVHLLLCAENAVLEQK